MQHSGLIAGMSAGREIRLIEEDDEWWSAIDEEAGVTSQEPTRQEPLENLDEATELAAEARSDETVGPEPDAPWFPRTAFYERHHYPR